MTRKEAIRSAQSCRGHIFTTDELWADDENCILTDALGNLIYGNGELIENENDLPLDGWWDATDDASDYQDDINEDYHTKDNVHESVLWDPDDM